MTLLAINDAAYISRMARAIYDRITVAGPEIVGVRLTQAAYAHGSALALPQKVELARRQVLGARFSNLRDPDRGPR